MSATRYVLELADGRRTWGSRWRDGTWRDVEGRVVEPVGVVPVETCERPA